MVNYYFDIETQGFNPEIDKIISIQFQELDQQGKPKGPLTILKEWESNEKDIVVAFYKKLYISNVWSFVPVGYNLIFDFTFLWAKFKKYNLEVPTLDKYLYSKPIIDLKSPLVIANNLDFKGSSLDRMTNKETNGGDIPNFYNNKEFNKIENYIKQETESFIECLEKLRTKLMEAFNKNVQVK